MPVLAGPACGGGGGGGLCAPAEEAGDPHTLQKAAPSEIADPHFEQNAIFPPVD